MSVRSFSLQQAIYGALAADPGVQAELGAPARVFDDPPADAALPYAVIGETRASRIPGHPTGVEHEIRIEIVSRHAGRREVKRILDRLYDALHEAELALDGARLVNLRFVFADVFRRDGGEVYAGLARFRAVTEAA
jgi:hypothetical protein